MRDQASPQQSSMRLNRFLALAGVASRRAVELIIREGRITIDGLTVSDPAVQVSVQAADVKLDGKRIQLTPAVTYMMNKPRGIVSTAHDPHGATTVIQLVQRSGINHRLYPVGRLDKNSHGLLLLSNDGELAFRLMHPRYHIAKTYDVVLDRALTATQLVLFAQGLHLEDGMTAACRIEPLQSARPTYRIVLFEGRKRQIRRMFEVFFRKVLDLNRISIGPLSLGNLAEGGIKLLQPREVNSLYRAVGLRRTSS